MYLFGDEIKKSLNDIKIPNVNISSILWPRNRQRYGYTATYLPKTGEIIIIGGIDDSKKPVDMKSLDVYNTTNSSWTQWDIPKNSPDERALHTAILYKNDKIIILGGDNNNNTIYVLDVNTKKWHSLEWDSDSKIEVHAFYTATLLHDNKIIAFVNIGNKTDKYMVTFEINEEFKFSEVNSFTLPTPTHSSTPDTVHDDSSTSKPEDSPTTAPTSTPHTTPTSRITSTPTPSSMPSTTLTIIIKPALPPTSEPSTSKSKHSSTTQTSTSATEHSSTTSTAPTPTPSSTTPPSNTPPSPQLIVTGIVVTTLGLAITGYIMYKRWRGKILI